MSEMEVNGCYNVVDLLPTKSKERYEKAYKAFTDWYKSKEINELTEDVFLAYFGEKANTYKPSSLWSTFSMLKRTLMVEHDLNIGRFRKLLAFLKKKNLGFQPKKSKIFSRDEVDNFLLNAPDKEFLLIKVVLIMGLAGAMRCEELVKLTLDDVDEKDGVLLVKIRDTKTYKPRSFVVNEGNNKINIFLYKKYVALRSPHTPHRRVFVSYRGGKCTIQPVGIHTFAKMSAKIAEFLQLPQPELYTGHCLRRSSATLLVDGGGYPTVLKRHGGWRSSTVAESYTDESSQSRLCIANHIERQQTSRKADEECVKEELMDGNRIINMKHFLETLAKICNHGSSFNCSFKNFKIREIRRGLVSKYIFHCNMCQETFEIASQSSEDMNLNEAVNGIMSTGGGFYNLEEFLASLNIPCTTSKRHRNYQEKVNSEWTETAQEVMRKAPKEEVRIMSSHHLPSTSQSSAPPTKKVKRGEIAVKATNAKAQRKGNSSTPSSANSGTLVVKTEATREENSPQCSGTQTFDEVVIKKEINDTSSENDTVSQIKGAKEDKRSVGSKANEETENSGNFSFLPILTKTEIKSESEDNEEPAEVQDLDVKEEEFIIKEESDEEDWETRSTSNASTQTDDNEDERTAMNEEVERLLAQLGPKKKTIKGQKAQFTDNDVLQFTITLLRGKGAPRIWRRFQVPATYTFREFHIAIQKAMGWKSVQFDYHLHAFRMINPSTGYEDTIVMREDVGFYDNSKDENVTKIKDYCTIVNHKGKYEYDFGISWQHEYVFEGSSPRVEGKTYPVCLEGEKACPPEDGVESDEDYDSDAFDAEACF